KNLGKKNCELSDEDIKRVCDTFLAFKENEHSKIFPNEAFGYWKVKVERPLRLRAQFTRKAVQDLLFTSGDEEIRRELFNRLIKEFYEPVDFARVRNQMAELIDEWNEDE